MDTLRFHKSVGADNLLTQGQLSIGAITISSDLSGTQEKGHQSGLCSNTLREGIMTVDSPEPIQQARVWGDEQWTARVIKNEDDDGWAVAMYLAGESEPALVGPWTMGRDKKNPKPLDASAFSTLVKTSKEFVRRSEQQLHAQLNKSVTVTVEGSRVRVALAIVPDEEGAAATLCAQNEFGDELARVRVSPAFKLNVDSAQTWIESGYERPQRSVTGPN